MEELQLRFNPKDQPGDTSQTVWSHKYIHICAEMAKDCNLLLV